MNKGIAHILMTRLASIKFIDLYAGVVSIQEKEDLVQDRPDSQARKVLNKFPVSCDVIDFGNCPATAGTLVPLVPDSNRKGILYFEDNGTDLLKRTLTYNHYSSNLRLVVWLNTRYIDINACYELTMPVMTYIINKLSITHFNQGNYKKILPTVNRIPKTGKEIFSAYTYDSARTQYLLPPFEYFALDLKVTYSIHPNCIDEISIIEPSC